MRVPEPGAAPERRGTPTGFATPRALEAGLESLPGCVVDVSDRQAYRHMELGSRRGAAAPDPVQAARRLRQRGGPGGRASSNAGNSGQRSGASPRWRSRAGVLVWPWPWAPALATDDEPKDVVARKLGGTRTSDACSNA